jgi:hypothetical protein
MAFGMNSSISLDEILDNVKKLIEAGKTESLNLQEEYFHQDKGCPTVLPFNEEMAEYLSLKLSEIDHYHLIKGMIIHINEAGKSASGGSVSPIPPIYFRYLDKYPDKADKLSDWVNKNRTFF